MEVSSNSASQYKMHGKERSISADPERYIALLQRIISLRQRETGFHASKHQTGHRHSGQRAVSPWASSIQIQEE